MCVCDNMSLKVKVHLIKLNMWPNSSKEVFA